MFTRRIYARLLIPSAALVTADNNNNEDGFTCRPSELPIYFKDDDKKKKEKEKEVAKEEELPPPNGLENFFGSIRRSVVSMTEETVALKQNAYDLIDDTQKNFEWLVSYLQEEENTNAKYGAIAIGGLAGYILGMRGRFFRRTLFATAGAAGMASICYPEEAAEYSQMAIEEGRKYATIAYNFIYGVQKDDPPLELPSLPKIPTNMSEIWGVAADMGKSIKSVFSEGEVEDTPAVAKVEEVIEESIVEEIDVHADELVSQVYEEASHKACHCPIGVCTRHDEQPPPPPPSSATSETCVPCPDPK